MTFFNKMCESPMKTCNEFIQNFIIYLINATRLHRFIVIDLKQFCFHLARGNFSRAIFCRRKKNSSPRLPSEVTLELLKFFLTFPWVEEELGSTARKQFYRYESEVQIPVNLCAPRSTLNLRRSSPGITVGFQLFVATDKIS